MWRHLLTLAKMRILILLLLIHVFSCITLSPLLSIPSSFFSFLSPLSYRFSPFICLLHLILSIVRKKVISLKNSIDVHLKDGRRGERMREGVNVAIVGPPNAGKSSLMNILGIFCDLSRPFIPLSSSSPFSFFPSNDTY